MHKIEKPALYHQGLLSEIGRQTFIESHGSSADKMVIDEYVEKKFSKSTIEAELEEKKTCSTSFMLIMNLQGIRKSF